MIGRRTQGFALLPVILAVLTIAAAAVLISGESVMESRLRADEFNREAAQLVARGAAAHALWDYDTLGCTGYAGISGGSLGTKTYDVSVTPTTGSPVTLTATATDAAGSSVTITSTRQVFDTTVSPLVLQPGAAGKDAFVQEDRSNWNHGASVTIDVQGGIGSARRGIVEFDLSAFPAAARLVSADLDLKIATDNTSGNIDVHRVERAWVEGTSTGKNSQTTVAWNHPHGNEDWLTAGGDFAASALDQANASGAGNWVTWDVTATVSDWLAGRSANYGFLLVPVGATDIAFTSGDDAVSADHPTLTLQYVCECGETC